VTARAEVVESEGLQLRLKKPGALRLISLKQKKALMENAEFKGLKEIGETAVIQGHLARKAHLDPRAKRARLDLRDLLGRMEHQAHAV